MPEVEPTPAETPQAARGTTAAPRDRPIVKLGGGAAFVFGAGAFMQGMPFLAVALMALGLGLFAAGSHAKPGKAQWIAGAFVLALAAPFMHTEMVEARNGRHLRALLPIVQQQFPDARILQSTGGPSLWFEAETDAEKQRFIEFVHPLVAERTGVDTRGAFCGMVRVRWVPAAEQEPAPDEQK
jgi:hypothetical protein